MDLIDRRDDHDRDGARDPRDGGDPPADGDPCDRDPGDRRDRVAFGVDRPLVDRPPVGQRATVDRRRAGDRRPSVDSQRSGDRRLPADRRGRYVPGAGGDFGP